METTGTTPQPTVYQIDDSSITKLDGDLVAIHRLLDEHYARFGNLCEPFMGVVNGTRVVTYDLLGYSTRETSLALTNACRKNVLDACNLGFNKRLAHSLHKPTFAVLLLAEALATTFPKTVTFANVIAVQSLVTKETESSLITTMWYLSQAASSSTPISVYGQRGGGGGGREVMGKGEEEETEIKTGYSATVTTIFS